MMHNQLVNDALALVSGTQKGKVNYNLANVGQTGASAFVRSFHDRVRHPPIVQKCIHERSIYPNWTLEGKAKMAEIQKIKGVIGILTGGGDVPGLNPAIRAVTIRALREGYKVIGIRRGWAGTMEIIRDEQADNSENFIVLTEEIVNRAGRTGGTFLHTSRTNPSAVSRASVPDHLRDQVHRRQE